jgi:hypothetical protein
METAPRDGTRVLLCFPAEKLDDPKDYAMIGEWDAEAEDWKDDFGGYAGRLKPVSWSSLPPAKIGGEG